MFDTTEEQFDQFINMVAPLVKNVRMIEYMRKIHRKTSPAFLESVQFHKLLESQRKHVETDSANIFVHLREFCTELKAYRVEAKKRKLDSDDERTGTDTNGVASSQNDDEPVSKSFKVNDAHDLTQVNASVENTANGSSPNGARDSLCDRIELTSVEGNHEDVASSSTCNQADYVEVLHSVAGPSYAAVRVEAATATTGKSEKKKVSDRQVRKFEKLLKLLDTEIRRLQEKEMSLEDMDSDASYYLREEQLKKRFVKVWNMLCELKGRTSETGRYMEKRFRYEGSRYHEVNRSVERFINKKKIFPDFHDICRVVDKVNGKANLCLSASGVTSLARQVFRDVGEQLQCERRRDFAADFGCHLTDVAAATAGEEGAAAMDPAEESEELRQRLDENARVNEKRLAQVLDKYEQKEVELGLQPEEVSISGEVDSSSDDAEEKEDVVDDDDEDTEQADTSRDSHADEEEEEEEDGEVSESEEEDSSTGIAGIDSQSAEDEVEQEEEEEDESELEEEAEDAMEEEEAEKSVSDDIEGTSNDVTATEENPHAIGVEKLTAATSEDSTEFSGSASCQQVPTNYIANADVPSGATSWQCRTTTAGSAEEELGGTTSGSSRNGGEVTPVKHEIATRGRSGSDGDAGTSMCTSDPAENATRGRSGSDGDEETSPSSPEAMPIILQEMLRADQSEAGGGSRRAPVGGTTVEVIELLDSDSDVESSEVRHEGAPAVVRAARPESERTCNNEIRVLSVMSLSAGPSGRQVAPQAFPSWQPRGSYGGAPQQRRVELMTTQRQSARKSFPVLAAVVTGGSLRPHQMEPAFIPMPALDVATATAATVSQHLSYVGRTNATMAVGMSVERRLTVAPSGMVALTSARLSAATPYYRGAVQESRQPRLAASVANPRCSLPMLAPRRTPSHTLSNSEVEIVKID